MLSNSRLDERSEVAKWVANDREHLWHHLTQHRHFLNQEPMIIVEGKGCIVKDHHGREYLDAVSGGVWCVNVGHGQESIAEVVYEQLKRLPYYALTVGNPPAIILSEKLTSLLPGLEKVFFSNSGSEANEKAFKMSRQYSRLKYSNKDKHKIVYRSRDYHGTTFGALSATGQRERKTGYEPLVPGFLEIPHAYCYRCSFDKTYPNCDIDCALALEEVIKTEGEDTIAAVIVEPITAGGGILVPVEEYFPLIQKICRKYEVLLIMDEVVNGFGRTGKMFGHQHWDVDPDIITMAKGMASGYMPISATMSKAKIFDRFLDDPDEKLGYFRDISTYGGSAGACAAALQNIDIIERQKLCENSEKMGSYLLESLKELESIPIVGDIRGRGLLVGIELVQDKDRKVPVSEEFLARVVTRIREQGVLVGKMNRSVPGHNNVLFLAPPLVITENEIIKLVSSIRNALEDQK